MPLLRSEPSIDRRAQILQAALACFAKKGFYAASMHDISAEAGISVGLIYRYFENKDAIISAMAEEHEKEIRELLERARNAPSLRDSLEIMLTAHCCEDSPQLHAAFVVDLFAEAGRNAHVANLVRGILDTLMDGMSDVIARAPEMRETAHGLAPREITDLIFATARGSIMRDALERENIPSAERRARQLAVVRNLWRLLFSPEPALTSA